MIFTQFHNSHSHSHNVDERSIQFCLVIKLFKMVCITAIIHILSTRICNQIGKRAIREVAHSFVLSLGKSLVERGAIVQHALCSLAQIHESFRFSTCLKLEFDPSSG